VKILVVGGTSGFIGTHVVRRLAAGGHEVTVFHRGQANAELPPSIRHILGDRRQSSDFANEFKRLAPQVVLDMYLRFEQDAATLMHTFRGTAERIVAVSSQDVYRTYGILWRREDTEPNVPQSARTRPYVVSYTPTARWLRMKMTRSITTIKFLSSAS
jgi:NAD(P)-dependent dehydrogenase (short-subunit alcohol dehydrogenase family)